LVLEFSMAQTGSVFARDAYLHQSPADAGEVVAIGSSDPLDYAEVAEPAKLA
jgi:hypothetical protein